MRTTLTLDPDVMHLVQEEVHRRRTTFKQVVNDAIRLALSRRPKKAKLEPFRVKPHSTILLSGVDRNAMNRLADELENAAVMAKTGKRRKQ